MRWITVDEAKVLVLLWLLFALVQGLERAGLVRWVARRFEAGRFIALRLVVVTFFLAALVTNDVALIRVVPLTLELNTEGKGFIVILETLAANAGSALTPFGNPQNLSLYWFDHLNAWGLFRNLPRRPRPTGGPAVYPSAPRGGKHQRVRQPHRFDRHLDRPETQLRFPSQNAQDAAGFSSPSSQPARSPSQPHAG